MLAAAGVAAGALIGGVGAAPAHAATSNAAYFVNAINAQRVAHGRPRLAVSATMTAAAQRWADQMARSNRLYHNPGLASSVSNWKYLGENVGVGYSDSSLEGAFYASAPHRANMLDRDFTEIGVAVVVVHGKMWVAEEYRRPMHATAEPQAVHKTTKHKATKHKAKPVNLGRRQPRLPRRGGAAAAAHHRGRDLRPADPGRGGDLPAPPPPPGHRPGDRADPRRPARLKPGATEARRD